MDALRSDIVGLMRDVEENKAGIAAARYADVASMME
jgi:hypothetical protein